MSRYVFLILSVFVSIDIAYSVHIDELKKRSDIRLLFRPRQPGPDDKLCSSYMNQLMKLAEPIRDEIVAKGDANEIPSFQYFLKKLTNAGLKSGISNKTLCTTQIVIKFKPNTNLLYDYWSQNFRRKL